jgi:hypothetical protein
MDKLPHPSRIFKTPNDLLEAWKAYKKSLQSKALEWPKIQYVGKDGTRVEDYPKLPLVMDGFESFCYDFYGCVNQYFDNKDGYYDDFVTICSHIRKEIRADQITGGLLGNYNASITNRLNNLTESTTTELTGNLPTSVTFNFTDMSGDNSEENELL